MTPQYITFSNLIIDDIVLWDGRTFMATLGGAGTHALMGMRVWERRLGFVATVGEDLPSAQRAQLEQLGIDLRGMRVESTLKTTRAWQIFEPDERRIEILRTDLRAFLEFAPRFADIPADYHQAIGLHILWGETLAELNELLTQIRAQQPTTCLVLEPAPAQDRNDPTTYQAILPQVDLFSPDIDQARKITGQSAPSDMAQTLLAWGAPLVAIRMGATGSLLATAAGQRYAIPAIPPAQLVDVTGAGNAYCGGFLTGLGAGLSPLEAALRAAVSASFALEQFGVPSFEKGMMEEVERRLAWVRGRYDHHALP